MRPRGGKIKSVSLFMRPVQMRLLSMTRREVEAVGEVLLIFTKIRVNDLEDLSNSNARMERGDK